AAYCSASSARAEFLQRVRRLLTGGSLRPGARARRQPPRITIPRRGFAYSGTLCFSLQPLLSDKSDLSDSSDNRFCFKWHFAVRQLPARRRRRLFFIKQLCKKLEKPDFTMYIKLLFL
ncbi:MAG: hypothetical protein IJY46_03810, partial [Lentisphaeria bacterium]|nr:hypothetical protein [Lentisphaeria bacterium]